ncbi:MAG: metallophosphoesterase [Deltaproteobacteria bacterium]|jgi:predicted MPP superfamily phosphohydrolase|nr:metallophosphoesterase [Deltaproteobacteria bacterium]
MFANVALILFLYVFLSYIYPLPLKKRHKALLGLLALLSAGRLAILRFFWGGYGGVEVAKEVLLVTSFFQGLIFALFFLGLIRDLAWLLSFLGSFGHLKEKAARAREFLRGVPATVAIALFSAFLSLYTLHEGARVPDVVETEVTLERWPSELDRLRVVLLSDLHLCRLFDAQWAEEVVRRVNALSPDLILIPGDLVDGEVSLRAPETEPLARLRSPNGVYISMGNHEYISRLPDWLPAFKALGLRVLYNSHEVIEIRGAPLVLAGVTDPSAERYALPGPDLRKALEGVPRDGPPTILLDHRPARAHGNALDGRVDLQISGHAHGGPVPIVSWFVRAANGGFLKGWYQVGSLKMYAHPGSALWSGFPARLWNPPEISLLTIRSPAPRDV